MEKCFSVKQTVPQKTSGADRRGDGSKKQKGET